MTDHAKLRHTITSHRDEVTRTTQYELHFDDGSSAVFKDMSTAQRIARLLEMFEIHEDADGKVRYGTGRPEEQPLIYDILAAHLRIHGVCCGRVQPDTALPGDFVAAASTDSPGAGGDQLPAPQCPRDVTG